MQRSVAPLACGARVCTCEDRARRVCAYTRDESMSMCSCTRGVYTDEEEMSTHDEGQSVCVEEAYAWWHVEGVHKVDMRRDQLQVRGPLAVCEVYARPYMYARRRGATICETRGSTEQARIAPAAWSPRRMRGICEVVREAARGDYLRKEGGARCTRGKQHTMSGQHNATRAAR